MNEPVSDDVVSSGSTAAGATEAFERRGFWASVRESLAGSHQDFTKGPIGRSILLLAVPMVLEMAMESLFGVFDVFFISRLGEDAVATVGLTEGLLTILFAVAIGLSMSTTAIVARRIGEKDPEGASRTAAQAIGLGALVSIAVGIPGVIFAPDLLRMMKASEAVIETGSSYTALMLGGNATILFLFLLNAVFRGIGDAAIAMKVLWLGNGINMILDPCLIFGVGPFPELGLFGGAVGSTVGRGVAVAVQLYVLFGGKSRVTLARRHMRLLPKEMWNLVRVSIGGILQFLVATASWLGLITILADFGSKALAGYTIALRIIIVALLPSWGLANAAATLVGQSLGARDPARAERAVWITAFLNMGFLGLVAVTFIVFPWPIVAVFATGTVHPDVLPVGVDCLRYVSYGYVFYALGMVLVQAFNGAGDTFTPTVINLVCYWLLQIPLAYTLAHVLGLGPRGVFLAITIAESVIAVVGLIVFRRGKWKTRRV